MTKPKKLYIAIPYTNVDRENSFMIANNVAANLMKMGHVVFSPISHGHAISMKNKLPAEWEFWKKSCYEFLSFADVLIVVKIWGWSDSVGVNAEILIAKELGLRVIYLDFDCNGNLILSDII